MAKIDMPKEILDNDFCVIMKQNDNDEFSKYQKCDKSTQVSTTFRQCMTFFKCQEKSVSYLNSKLYIII